MDTEEGESVQTYTNSRQKKSSSPRSNSRRNAEIVSSVIQNKWWPFDRVDGKLLEKLNKQSRKLEMEDAPI